MPATYLINESLRLIFFGGKGGVGKTTTAAASALLLAERYPAKKILLVSTDPAHSLGDSFDKKLSDEAVLSDSHANLSLREFDAPKALESFKKKYGHEIKLIAERGTYFEYEDISPFLDLSFPGIDEVMGIFEILKLTSKYDMVIVDTAPTGHTLSMLKLPAILKKWLGVFALMGEKHHVLEDHFAKRRSNNEADAFIEMMNTRLTRVSNLLRNARETEFVVVTNPEEMVLAETERLLHALSALKMPPVMTLVVNRVYEGSGCPYCERRSAQQSLFVERLGQKSSYKKVLIPVFPLEIKGITRLKMFASALMGFSHPIADAVSHKVAAHKFNERLRLNDVDKARFVIIGGKGGVGKTTASAATALALAERNKDRTYKLYSIDPAHSLGDCFKRQIGGKGLQILPNLSVYELDADKLYLEFQEEYRSAVNELFDQFAGGSSPDRGVDLGYDRELLNELFEMAPPGLSELMALHQVILALGKTDCVIFDTAPTGHFVRFLELPALAREWLKAIFQLLLKYKAVMRMGSVAVKLVTLSKDIRAVMDIMTDHKKTAVVVVTIPRAMAVVEAQRLLESLDKHEIKCGDIVVNMAAQVGDCDFCTACAADEAVWIEKAKTLCKSTVVIPYLATETCGIENLREFGRMIWK
ncbi:MAG: ArsA family ATPase [Verrucomicrobiota bacterium]|jgi:arsenite/tail-anchored protein-transporting ATPase